MAALWVLIGVLVFLFIVAVVVGLVVMGMYNSLVRQKVEVDNAFSQIDVQLKRRHDLIPNLVETVKGYTAHERGTLEAVVKARQQAIDTSGLQARAQAENVLTGALRQLFALSENYPDLKANQNYLALQEELTSTENKIGFARQFYNDTVGNYNTSIQQFPANILAGMFHFTAREFFQVPEGPEREVPKVQF